jgi:hypothetical protein
MRLFQIITKLILCLLVVAFSGCGEGVGGGAGLNGAITVTATVTGSVINATATYTNPKQANVIGVPIAFTAQIGNQSIDLGTHNTNNSGTIAVAFTPPAFNGTQTITVIAKSANLEGFASVQMTGRSMTVTAPPDVTLTLPPGAVAGDTVPFTISAATFVAITDPFSTDLAGHTIDVSFTAVKNNPGNTVTLISNTTTTNSGGTAPFPGAVGQMVVLSGTPSTLSITWTATDTVTGLFGTGITNVTLPAGP